MYCLLTISLKFINLRKQHRFLKILYVIFNLNIEKFIYLNILKHNMAVKTITVTEKAYYALSSVKEKNESFSETLLRMTNRKPISLFFGALSKGNGEKLENSVKEVRKMRQKGHEKRIERIVAALGES